MMNSSARMSAGKMEGAALLLSHKHIAHSLDLLLLSAFPVRGRHIVLICCRNKDQRKDDPCKVYVGGDQWYKSWNRCSYV